MGWIEIPHGTLIVAMETGPLTEEAAPFPKIVVTLLSLLCKIKFNVEFAPFFRPIEIK